MNVIQRRISGMAIVKNKKTIRKVMQFMAYYNGDEYDDFTSDGENDYEDSFSERYDRYNGALFGTFDLNGDGDLDFLEKGTKLNHYQSLWEKEDQNLTSHEDYFLDDLIEEDAFSKKDIFTKKDRFIGLDYNNIENNKEVLKDIAEQEVDESQTDIEEQKYYSYSFLSSEEIRMKELDERRRRAEKKYKEGYVEGNSSKAYNYFYGLEQMEKGTKEDLEVALKHLTLAIGFYPDIKEKIEYCKEEISRLESIEREKDKKEKYQQAMEYMNKKDYKEAMKIFNSLGTYENAIKNYSICKKGHKKNIMVGWLIALAFVLVYIVCKNYFL